MKSFISTCIILLLNGCQFQKPTEVQYPISPEEISFDTYHGVEVPDAYQWLEDLSSDKTKKWMKAQDSLTEAYLDAIPERKLIEEKLNQYSQMTTYLRPIKGGDRYFYLESLPNEIGKLKYKESKEATPKLLIDPNDGDKNGSRSLSIISPSSDGSKLAYSTSSSTLWSEVRIMEVSTREKYDERLTGFTPNSSIVWNSKSTGFYYMRFDDPPAGKEMEATPVNSRIMYHELGTPQEEDQLVFSTKEQDKWILTSLRLTKNDEYLIFNLNGASESGNAIYLKPLKTNREAIELIQLSDESHSYIGQDDEHLFIQTTNNAQNGQVIKLNVKDPSNWITVIKESSNYQLVNAVVTGNKISCWYSEDVKPKLKVFDFDGELTWEIGLPSTSGYLRSYSFIGNNNNDPELFFDFRSTSRPLSLYVLNSDTGELNEFMIDKNIPWDPNEIIITQEFYKGKDGARVPMFLIYHKDSPPNGNNITFMPAYGAGGWIMNTGSNAMYILLSKIGGLIAIPGIRGGGEYGKQWHDSGTGINKPNTFSDYIAAAEYLIDRGYANPELLIAQGMSAGSTVPAVVTGQRPDLFGFNLPTWPIADMLRFTNFTGGNYWTSEYGSPDNEESFEVLYSYSPYHNIKKGECYPPTLVVAGELDNIAVPSHAYKYIAALQNGQSCEKPILLDIVWGGGHLANSKNRNKLYANYVAMWLKEFDKEYLIDKVK